MWDEGEHWLCHGSKGWTSSGTFADDFVMLRVMFSVTMPWLFGSSRSRAPRWEREQQQRFTKHGIRDYQLAKVYEGAHTHEFFAQAAGLMFRDGAEEGRGSKLDDALCDMFFQAATRADLGCSAGTLADARPVRRPGLGDSWATLLAVTTLKTLSAAEVMHETRHHFPRMLRSNPERRYQMHERPNDLRQRARVEQEARHEDAQAVPASFARCLLQRDFAMQQGQRRVAGHAASPLGARRPNVKER